MAALSVTYLLSILLQNLLCCIPIVAVLHDKSRCFFLFKKTIFYNKTTPLFFLLKFTRFLGILYFLSKTASLSVSGTR